MKSLRLKNFLIMMSACVFYLSSCSSEAHNGKSSSAENAGTETKMVVQADKLTGVWMQQDTENNMVNPLEGYEFKKDGTLIPLNINTLEKGSWDIKNDKLVLHLKSAEDKTLNTVQYKVSVSRDELTLMALNSNENTKETYLRIR